MRSRRRSELAVLVVLAAIGVAAWLTVRSSQPTATSSVAPQGVSWTGLVGSPRAALPHANRMIVVLRVPSVAQRVATAKLATEAAERRWAAEAFAAQQQVLTQLARHGLATKPDYSYARVIDGFSAVLDPRALPLLEHNPEVAGVFPVRAAYPATIPLTAAGATAAVPGIALPGNDGTGVTIALLDTGVDLEHPYLGGRVEQGIDVVGGTGTAAAQRDPQNRTLVERHGTELAGVLVGSGGPGGMQGVAPGASVIPIRVAGWQPTLSGVDSIYARSDQVIEGLERAVDPNGDGDTHDAARIALLGVVEPFASFPDSPEAQAVDGAGILDMLVVAPAGNDGAAGPLFGSIAGPGGSPAALTVGATDPRLETSTARLVLRQGLAVMADSLLPLLGTTSPAHPLDLQVAERGAPGALRGKAALLPVGPNPVATVRVAARNGAAAVLLYGRSLPAGSIRDAGVPVLGVPSSIARAALKLVRQRFKLVATIGLERSAPNPLDRPACAVLLPGAHLRRDARPAADRARDRDPDIRSREFRRRRAGIHGGDRHERVGSGGRRSGRAAGAGPAGAHRVRPCEPAHRVGATVRRRRRSRRGGRRGDLRLDDLALVRPLDRPGLAQDGRARRQERVDPAAHRPDSVELTAALGRARRSSCSLPAASSPCG